MTGGQLAVVWALLALALAGIPGYWLGWWNGRRCLRADLADRPEQLAAVIEPPTRPLAIAGRLSLTCPRCGMTSYHPDDVEQGYCGRCHDWTVPRRRVPENADPFPTTPIALWSPHQAMLDRTEAEIARMIAAADERDPYRRRHP